MSIEENPSKHHIQDIEDEIEIDESEYENDETIDEEDLDKQEEENKSIFYQTRVRSLIKSIAESEDYDIQIGKKGFESFNESIKFITVMLAYEVVEDLKAQNRKKITPVFVDRALSKMLGRADALSLAIKELEQVLDTLEVKSGTTSITKAMDYLNILVTNEQEDNVKTIEISVENDNEEKIGGKEEIYKK
ncbi:hypothetical protein SOP93_17040 [Peribacillus frigoritolerans]|uniref:hypothetical protein n=1 Tax=Peribacillus frigoritolerans TaxID=450367 RepID=UPI002B247983|nr:hypothetical protein [Peribacillus frigoritolerans]MEB2492872.1 hypothetical protein [Peribacillus frigoritolerans]